MTIGDPLDRSKANTITNSKGPGISISSYSDGIRVYDTLITTTTGYGIRASNAANVTLARNTIVDTGFQGIYLHNANAGAFVVRDNVLRNINRVGATTNDVIQVLAGSAFSSLTIAGNDYTNPAGYVVNRFIEVHFPAASVSGNTTNTGKSTYVGTSGGCFFSPDRGGKGRDRMYGKTCLTIAAALSATCVANGDATAAVTLSETFETYADRAALQAVWINTTTPTAFILNNTGFDPTPTPLATVPQSTVTNLGRFAANQVAYRDFAAQPAGSNFSVKADMIFEGYSRSIGFALTDASGQGYVFRWNAANVNNNTGRGTVDINEHPTGAVGIGDLGVMTRPTYGVDAFGVPNESDPTPFTTAAGPNMFHPVTGYRVTANTGTDQNAATYDSTFRGLVTLTLTYDAATGTLRAYNNGSDNPRPDIPMPRSSTRRR